MQENLWLKKPLTEGINCFVWNWEATGEWDISKGTYFNIFPVLYSRDVYRNTGCSDQCNMSVLVIAGKPTSTRNPLDNSPFPGGGASSCRIAGCACIFRFRSRGVWSTRNYITFLPGYPWGRLWTLRALRHGTRTNAARVLPQHSVMSSSLPPGSPGTTINFKISFGTANPQRNNNSTLYLEVNRYSL